MGVLVLTGETSKADAEKHAAPPDLIVAGLTEFGEQLRAGRSQIIPA
jgi:hypothetical protein